MWSSFKGFSLNYSGLDHEGIFNGERKRLEDDPRLAQKESLIPSKNFLKAGNVGISKI